MSGPEITLTAAPAPASDDPKAVAYPIPSVGDNRPDPSTAPIREAAPHRDTFLGNLAFLVRFAFGRY